MKTSLTTSSSRSAIAVLIRLQKRHGRKKNVWVLYCPYWGVALSMIHPLTHLSNAEALNFLAGWLKVAPNNIGIYDYNLYYTPSWDAMAKKVKWYAQKGIREIWHCGRPRCFGDLFRYVISRLEWNPGLDEHALKEEFVRAYYGPAAPYVLQYLKLMENRINRGYTKGCHEFHMPPAFYSYEFMVGSLLLFDRMLEAARDDEKLRARITRDRGQFIADYRKAVTLRTKGLTPAERELAVRIAKESISQALERLRGLEKQLNARNISKPLLERIEKKYKSLGASIRQQVQRFTGTSLPKSMTPFQVAQAFIQDYEALTRKYPKKPMKTRAEKIDGGIRLPATAFDGGFGPRKYAWYCEERMTMTAYAAKSPRPSEIWAEFTLGRVPRKTATIVIEGQDADKDLPPKANLVITLNGKTIFNGPCRFVKRGWSWDSFPVPRGTLRKGKNTLRLKNTAPSARLDHYWFMISEARILFKN